jgi:hypothetical protein
MLIDNTGMDNVRARRLAQTMFGGESSGAPLGIGLVDVTPFVIPLAAQEAGISAGEAREAAQAGEYGKAALSYGTGVLQGLDVVPGVALAAKGGKALGEALAPAAADVMEKYLTKTGAILKMAPDSPGIEVKSAPKLNTLAFKNWFANSKAVDDKGNPAVWYHGSLKEFDEFKKPSSSSAIFFSPQADFASSFANISKGNVLPVYLKALNPFDYDNPKHREAVINLAIENTPIYKNAPDQVGMRRVLEESLTSKDTGNWTTIEEKGFQDAIKSLGFDSFYVKERGVKNLGVYKPEQIKSVFNKGTFNPKDPRILYGGGAAGVATAGEEKK